MNEKPKTVNPDIVIVDVSLDATLERLRQVVVEKNRKFGRHGFERKDRREVRQPHKND